MPEVTPLPKAKKRRKARTVTNKSVADKLWAAIVKRGGVCELAEYGQCDGRLEAAHIIPRGRSGTRTDETNGRCLCQKHHRWFDSVDGAKVRVVGGAEYARLYAKAEAHTRAGVHPATFWREERERLTDLKQRLEGL